MNESGPKNKNELRKKLMGLGERSMRKNYYRELLDKQQKLEERNRQLELEVEQRKEAEHKLKVLNDELEDRVSERTAELEALIDELKETRDYLIRTEKLTALGELVVGISHEINTPLGIAVTSSSFLLKKIEEIHEEYTLGRLKKSEFESMIREMRKSADFVVSNLNKSLDLVQNFRTVAVDQTKYERRMFGVCPYIHTVISSLHVQLKDRPIEFEVICDGGGTIYSYPGIFSQILSNLIMNSLVHGYGDNEAGLIKISYKISKKHLWIYYEDDGKGMTEETVKRIFDPFFTTVRSGSRSGLGMYTVYNLVTHSLNGDIYCKSQPGEGAKFEIRIPLVDSIEVESKVENV